MPTHICVTELCYIRRKPLRTCANPSRICREPFVNACECVRTRRGTFANPSRTCANPSSPYANLREPIVNPSRTLRKPFANACELVAELSRICHEFARTRGSDPTVNVRQRTTDALTSTLSRNGGRAQATKAAVRHDRGRRGRSEGEAKAKRRLAQSGVALLLPWAGAARASRWRTRAK
eukprot:4635733-Prymnesium_polylepis.1